MNKPLVPIFFGFDERFAKFASVAMLSLIEHTDPKRNYRIHVLHTDLTKETIDKILSMERRNVSICINDVSKDIEELISHLPVRDYYSPSTYYRLLIADKFPLYNKALYIDSDTAILQDVGKLYDINLHHHLVGAVPEAVMRLEEPALYSKRCLGINNKRYFNAGVLVINSKKWREVKVMHQFIDLVHFYTFHVAQDQDYLNIICKDDVKYISRSWNMECIKDWKIAEKKRCLIHYAFAPKPWHDIQALYSQYFWDVAFRSPFYMDIKSVYASFTFEELAKEKRVALTVFEACLQEANNPDNYLNLIQRRNEEKEDSEEVVDEAGMIAAGV